MTRMEKDIRKLNPKEQVIKYAKEVLRIDNIQEDVLLLFDLLIKYQNRLWFDFIDRWWDRMRKSNDLWRIESRDDLEGILYDACIKRFGE